MTLPRLRADLRDARGVARVLRGALRLELVFVPLKAPPQNTGQHVLEVDVPGEGIVMLLADVVASPSAAGYPLYIRPRSRAQMAEILAIVERVDEPSVTVPPPADVDGFSDPHAATVDNTILDDVDGGALDVILSEAPAGFGVLESLTPGPAPDSLVPPVIPPRSRPASPAAPVPAARRPEDALLGRVLAGKYRIESVIGEGQSAAVFRATHADLKRSVAVKILHEHKLDQSQFVMRFKAEALAASRLEHANITRVIDFGEEPDGVLYLVMELLEGRSLDAMLKADGRLPQLKAVEYAIQACTGIACAHDNGIIHRDLKPENLMVVAHRDDDGNLSELVKVCDFGLAKLREPEAEHADITTAGMLCGSPAYMSPEQTRGEPLDARTDVYSLGVTLFETLTGELPHQADGLAAFFLKKLLEPPRRPSTLVPDIDPLLEDVLLRAIAADLALRHATARILREELRAVRDSLGAASEDREPTIFGG